MPEHRVAGAPLLKPMDQFRPMDPITAYWLLATNVYGKDLGEPDLAYYTLRGIILCNKKRISIFAKLLKGMHYAYLVLMH
jgi:hypothetical protein